MSEIKPEDREKWILGELEFFQSFLPTQGSDMKEWMVTEIDAVYSNARDSLEHIPAKGLGDVSYNDALMSVGRARKIMSEALNATLSMLSDADLMEVRKMTMNRIEEYLRNPVQPQPQVQIFSLDLSQLRDGGKGN